jgi:hypothetical protein
MQGSFRTALIAAVVAAVVSAGAAVATTQAFTLGTTNRVNAPSQVTNVQANGTTVSPVDGPLLTLANQSTSANATPLSLIASANHAPLKVNSAVKIANLNADKIDGLDSTVFAQGPARSRTVHAYIATGTTGYELAAYGSLHFLANCVESGGNQSVELMLGTSAAHASYAGVAGSDSGAAYYGVADTGLMQDLVYALGYKTEAIGTPVSVPALGTVVSPDERIVQYSLLGTKGSAHHGGTGGCHIVGSLVQMS